MSRIADTFDKRAAMVHATVALHKGEAPNSLYVPEKPGLLSAQDIKQNVLLDFKEAVTQADILRAGGKIKRPVELSLEVLVKEKFGFGSVDSFFSAIDVNPSFHTVDSLASMSDFNEGYRWLLPEVVRAAVQLGLRKAPIYPELIAAEENVDQKKVTLPSINMSDATPEVIGETETIPVGTVSFDERDVKLKKLGTGIKVSDEVQKYVSLNILSLYLQDAGVKLGLGMDTMAIDVLINGDGGTGSYAAPVIGVKSTTDGITYYDLLRAWIRMGRLGRTPSTMLSNENAALKILQMAEFKGANYNNKKQNINIKTPIPQSQDYLVHGAMPSAEILGLLDNSMALLKLNATALQVESARIAERQLNGTYVTITTGFAKLFRDAFLMIDGTQLFTDFPSFMNVNAAESVTIK